MFVNCYFWVITWQNAKIEISLADIMKCADNRDMCLKESGTVCNTGHLIVYGLGQLGQAFVRMYACRKL